MKIKLEILPKAQLKVWPMLESIPKSFILYGGTAIALQLGHRYSVDFDFFSAKKLNRHKLLETVSFLNQAYITQPEINTLNCQLRLKEGNVNIQFLAGIGHRQGRMENPIQTQDNGILIASLRDLLATKLNTIQMRAETKDYIDIDAMLQHSLTLQDGLACALAIYGPSFDPATSIRALCSYRDGTLPQLPQEIQKRLITTALKIEEIPKLEPISPTI
jgi:hypothetical protein